MLLFNWFVVPFTAGLGYLLVTLTIKYTGWIKNLNEENKLKIKKGFFSHQSLLALHEVFMESLLHRKVFKVNTLLGYMHASLAFGWFLLIITGNIESRIFYDGHISPPYLPIFFRFFNPNTESFRYGGLFSFLMDLILLIVLSGVALAWLKRMYSRILGMKKTTVLKLGDKLALSSLWLIFPMRFLAESFTSANHGGGSFLTSNAGIFFGNFLPTNILATPAWWGYSLSLGLFFIAVPYSRYMHIPTEILLIFLRKYGVAEQKNLTSYSMVEVNSCSRCGICLDPCQMTSAAKMKNVQSVYYLQNVRHQNTCDEQSLNCLMCGRCDQLCPVGIDIQSIRMAGRQQKSIQKANIFEYIPKIKKTKADVIYFAGCMTHLQPSIKKSMVTLMQTAGVNFWFMDESGSVCCGRPLMLAGKEAQARELMAKNKAAIEASGAKTLVTSCPICFRIFKEEYQLDIEILHHSQYLLQLVEEKKIEFKRQQISAVYHDPCELGRGSQIFEQPRELLNKLLELKTTSQEKEKSLCCGGSLANLQITNDQRKMITLDTIQTLTSCNPDMLITGCPLCKKTFTQSAPVQVLDIAEVFLKCLRIKHYVATSEFSDETEILEPSEIE